MTTYLDLCRSRRSIRKYTAQPVEQEKIDYILQCALMSPSGKRINPWEFFVVKDEAKLRKMAGCRAFGSGMFQTAMAAVIVAVDTSLTDVWMCDGAIAAHSILMAAEEKGLGACWCHINGREAGEDAGCRLAEEVVRREVGIPDNLTVLCAISLGYKDEERKQYDLEKLLYNKVHNA